MTPQQLATLKTYIDGQPDLSSQPMNGDGDFVIAQKLNLTAVPDAFTWKNRGEFSVGELLGNGYDYTRIDNLTTGKARIWEECKAAMTLGQFTGNQANHKAGITAAFTAAADDAMRLAIFGHLQRLATRFERVFLAGNGATTSNQGVGPLALVVAGPCQPSDVQQARALP